MLRGKRKYICTYHANERMHFEIIICHQTSDVELKDVWEIRYDSTYIYATVQLFVIIVRNVHDGGEEARCDIWSSQR